MENFESVQKYNYYKSIKEDILNVLECDYDIDEIGMENYEEINEALWIDDNVTGNGYSRGYYAKEDKCKEYLNNNLDLLFEAFYEFGYDAESIKKFYDKHGIQGLDSTIRCYLLGQVLTEILEELDEKREELENENTSVLEFLEDFEDA